MNTVPQKTCLAPLTSIEVSPHGHLTPCCWYGPNRNDKAQFNIDTTSIQEYRQSFLYPMYEKMKNNEYPDACSRCLNKGNLRTRVNYYEDMYDKDREEIEETKPLRTMDLRFGNLCNLSCITCTSYNSNYFYKVKKKGYYLWEDQYKNRNNDNWADNPKHIEDIKNNLHNIDLLYLTGGEPTINSGLADLLQHMIDNNHTNVKLDINTNLTNANDDFIKLIRHFKWRLMFSIDAVGELNDIIRWPSKFTSIEKNMKKFLDAAKPGDVFLLVPTVSIFNFFKLDQILEWMINFTKQYPNLYFKVSDNLNLLHQPQWMNVANIPNDLYVNQLQNIPEKFKKDFQVKVGTPPFISAKEEDGMYKDWDWPKILNETRKYFDSRGYDPIITGIPGI